MFIFIFLNVFIYFFIFNYKVLTYNTYLQAIYGTYATNKTILYLQYKTCNTYLQLDTYTTKLTVLYSTLYIYTHKKNSYLHY